MSDRWPRRPLIRARRSLPHGSPIATTRRSPTIRSGRSATPTSCWPTLSGSRRSRLNATVTIPFEVQKLDRDFARTHRQRAGGRDLLAEDASGRQRCRRTSMRAIATTADAVRSRMKATAASRSPSPCIRRRGERALLDRAIRMADALYENFRLNDPPFSGGERDAINCVQLYRVTRDGKHLALAKHYLDIRGLRRLREPEPPQPVATRRCSSRAKPSAMR